MSLLSKPSITTRAHRCSKRSLKAGAWATPRFRLNRRVTSRIIGAREATMARHASGGRARGLAVTAMLVVARTAAADPPTPSPSPPPSPSDDELELRDLSLEDLLAIRVVTPARAPEPLAEAPAKIIVLTRDDLRRRGYQQLADIFDDLPGMDVIRPWGDNWFAAYARGDRHVYGSSFLVMLDGVIFNDLWFLD